MAPEGAPSPSDEDAVAASMEPLAQTAGSQLAEGEVDLGPRVKVLEWPSSEAPGGRATVYVLGTAHVSQESCVEVRKLIQRVQPDVVFIELCHGRTAVLQPPEVLPEPNMSELFQAWRSGKRDSFGLVYGWFLSKVAHKLEVRPGEEFRVAYEEGCRCGAVVHLGDRPIQVTLRRTWSGLSRWQRYRLVGTLLWSAVSLPDADELNNMVEELRDGDLLEVAVRELGEAFPSLVHTLVHERNLYMVAVLQQVAQASSTVVAVVGRGHQAGICANWEKQDIDIKSLLTMPVDPPPWIPPRVKRWLFVGVAASTVGILVYLRVAKART